MLFMLINPLLTKMNSIHLKIIFFYATVQNAAEMRPDEIPEIEDYYILFAKETIESVKKYG